LEKAAVQHKKAQTIHLPVRRASSYRRQFITRPLPEQEKKQKEKKQKNYIVSHFQGTRRPRRGVPGELELGMWPPAFHTWVAIWEHRSVVPTRAIGVDEIQNA
jgi:hypothetical protein